MYTTGWKQSDSRKYVGYMGSFEGKTLLCDRRDILHSTF